jgi:hypothetical protein
VLSICALCTLVFWRHILVSLLNIFDEHVGSLNCNFKLISYIACLSMIWYLLNAINTYSYFKSFLIHYSTIEFVNQIYATLKILLVDYIFPPKNVHLQLYAHFLKLITMVTFITIFTVIVTITSRVIVAIVIMATELQYWCYCCSHLTGSRICYIIITNGRKLESTYMECPPVA